MENVFAIIFHAQSSYVRSQNNNSNDGILFVLIYGHSLRTTFETIKAFKSRET